MILLKQTSYIINQNFKKVYKFNEDFPPIFPEDAVDKQNTFYKQVK